MVHRALACGMGPPNPPVTRTWPLGLSLTTINKSRSTGLVNVFMLVLSLVRWWWCCCCLFLRQWMTVSSTTVVTVVVVAAWWQRQRWQRQRWRRRRWTMIGGESGRQLESRMVVVAVVVMVAVAAVVEVTIAGRLRQWQRQLWRHCGG